MKWLAEFARRRHSAGEKADEARQERELAERELAHSQELRRRDQPRIAEARKIRERNAISDLIRDALHAGYSHEQQSRGG